MDTLYTMWDAPSAYIVYYNNIVIHNVMYTPKVEFHETFSPGSIFPWHQV